MPRRALIVVIAILCLATLALAHGPSIRARGPGGPPLPTMTPTPTPTPGLTPLAMAVFGGRNLTGLLSPGTVLYQPLGTNLSAVTLAPNAGDLVSVSAVITASQQPPTWGDVLLFFAHTTPVTVALADGNAGTGSDGTWVGVTPALIAPSTALVALRTLQSASALGFSLTINRPLDAADQDLLVAAILSTNGSGASGCTVPPGWTLVKEEIGSNYLFNTLTPVLDVDTRVATATDPSTFTFVCPSGSSMVGFIDAVYAP